MSNFRKIIQKLKQLLYRKTTGAVVAAIISAIYIARNLNKQSPIIKLSYFLGALSQDIITEVIVNGTTVFFKSIGSEVWYQTNSALLTKDRLFKLLSKKPNVVFSSVDVDDSTKQNYVNLAVMAATAFFGYKAYNLITGQDQGAANLKKVYTSETRFTDIHGLNEAKKELQEIINFLRDPQRYKAVGARLRRGVLLYGPSGTGKTLLARAIAGEANCSFLSCAASEFIELYVGVGPKRVRELFARARSLAPCIIFIDEIDGIGTKRQSQFSGMEAGGGDNEKTSTLNQLLTEMDGFRENHDIVIIAATNRPTLLDEALIRSGRFDTKIKIGLPDLQDRVGIMRIHLRNKKHGITDIMLGKIAEGTNGFSGADMENIINECAYVCVQNNRNVIEDSDLQEAFDKITTQRKLM